MLKPLLLTLLSAACLGSFVAAASSGGILDPSGVWLDENGEARIRIEHCERPTDRICGYLVWSKDTTGAVDTDDKNPDPRKKSRRVLGMQLILGLTPEDEEYIGKIYDADNGKTYDVKIWREDNGRLKVKGCVLKIPCGSQTWTPVSDVAPGQLIGPVDSENGPRADPEWALLLDKAPTRGGTPQKSVPTSKPPRLSESVPIVIGPLRGVLRGS